MNFQIRELNLYVSIKHVCNLFGVTSNLKIESTSTPLPPDGGERILIL